MKSCWFDCLDTTKGLVLVWKVNKKYINYKPIEFMNNLIKFMLFMTIITNNFVFDIEICSLHVWLIPICGFLLSQIKTFRILFVERDTKGGKFWSKHSNLHSYLPFLAKCFAYEKMILCNFFVVLLILILVLIWSISTHGGAADLLFNCVSTTVQYWCRWICSMVRCNPTTYVHALFPLFNSIYLEHHTQ